MAKIAMIAVDIQILLFKRGDYNKINNGSLEGFWAETQKFVSYYLIAFLADFTRPVKDFASFIAISAKILRSSSMPALLRPLMNCE